MSSQHPILKLGLDLLRNGSLLPDALVAYRGVLSMLDVDATKPLRLAALRSVFYEQKQVDEDVRPLTSVKWYNPTELDPRVICLPDQEQEPDVSSYKLKDELSGIADLVLLERAGTFIATSAQPSIPLFDLFKTAAALHDCLNSGASPDECLLVGCDFSGIQDTVYTITSKGALKTLRARSFMLELLCEHIIHEILSAVGADRHAVVYSGGGGFGLLLPNSEETVNKINGYCSRLNEWALDEFSGRLFIAIDVMPFGKEALSHKVGFQNLRQSQADRHDRLKRRKFNGQLSELFTPKMPEQLTVATECQITGRDDLKNEQMIDIGLSIGEIMTPENKHEDGRVWVSESCYRQFRIGDDLVSAQSVVRSDEVPEDTEAYFKFPASGWTKELNRWVYFRIGNDRTLSANCWPINDWTVGSPVLYAKYVRRHCDLPGYAQKKENESLVGEGRIAKYGDTATFMGLASSSCGADLIGALRMDVDNLGDMFSHIGCLTELSARSRLLNLFFKVYLNQICSERKGELDLLAKGNSEDIAMWGQHGRNVSIIYAGGDDLFIVGAWDDTVELAFDIQNLFERFAWGRRQENGGISAGLTLHQPKFPLYQMAHLSSEAEFYAKHDRDRGDRVLAKNRIALFFDHSKRQLKRRLELRGQEYRNRYMLSMTWGVAHDFLLPLMTVFMDCGKLHGDTNDRKSFTVDKFSFATVEKWFAVIAKYQESNLLYLPTMARVMRGIEKEFDDSADLFRRLVAILYTREEGTETWLSHFHIALNWLAYLRRTA